MTETTSKPEPGSVFLHIPEKSEWTCSLFGYFHYTPDRDSEPNAFHRIMQRLCFGVRWKRFPKPPVSEE